MRVLKVMRIVSASAPFKPDFGLSGAVLLLEESTGAGARAAALHKNLGGSKVAGVLRWLLP
jgi:hypothetical protein